MALDGITVAHMAKELSSALNGARITKVAQPEADELLLAVKGEGEPVRLLLSASASLPLALLTSENKPSPKTAPAFCMLLRKHLQGGKIRQVTQPGLERVLRIAVEHLNELGDLTTRTLVLELMGKHSNLILLDENERIIDAIKRIPASVSSVREVLPGKDYFIPNTTDKKDPLQATKQSFLVAVRSSAQPVDKTVYTTYIGLSPLAARQLVFSAGIDFDRSGMELNDEEAAHLAQAFLSLTDDVREGNFHAQMVRLHGVPKEYASFPLTLYAQSPDAECTDYDSISNLLTDFYKEKDAVVRIRQKSADLRRIVKTALERNVRKLDLQTAQLKDTLKKDRYRRYGELLTAYAYSVEEGAKEVTLTDYHTNEDVTIPLDPAMTAAQNASRYYDRYNKLKRTAANLETLTVEVQAGIDHLQSVLNALDIARSEDDLVPIRAELIEAGYLRKKSSDKGAKHTAKGTPMHFQTPDGFDIYVGKNNYQNDLLTMKEADGADWWFHAKKEAGSHVILKTAGREVPDSAFEAAAALAAYYSAARDQDKAEIDYVRRRHIKKPAGAKPGFVIYHTNYSMVIAPDIQGVTRIDA